MDVADSDGIRELAVVMLACLVTGGVGAIALSRVAGTPGLAVGLFGGSIIAFVVMRLFVLR